MPRQPYPSDLTDREWTKLKPLLPPDENRIGSPREVELREVVTIKGFVAKIELDTKSPHLVVDSGSHSENSGHEVQLS